MFATKLSFFFAILRVFALPGIYGRDDNDFSEAHAEYGVTWNYSDSDQWAETFPRCGGRRQSPVDIDMFDTIPNLGPLPNLRFNGYDNIPKNMSIINTGDTVQLDSTYDNDETPYLTGGLLSSRYMFTSIHFHWGPNDDKGSEHTINGKSFPLEMHMVHYKSEYGSEDNAFNYPDGFVTVARLFEVKKDENPACKKFGDYLEQVTNVGSEIIIEPFPLTDFNFYEKDNYYTYPGSITAPPCQEVINWIIPSKLLGIAEAQLEKFRAIKFKGDDDTNARPTQPLNGRELLFVQYIPSQ